MLRFVLRGLHYLMSEFILTYNIHRKLRLLPATLKYLTKVWLRSSVNLVIVDDTTGDPELETRQ